jgi:hypothetical protein
VTFPTLDTSTLPKSDMTVEAWVKLDGSATTGPGYAILSSVAASSASTVDLAFNLQCTGSSTSSASLVFSSGPSVSAGLAASSAEPCMNGAWHHTAATRTISGSNIHYQLFFDGAPVQSADGTTGYIGTYGPLMVGDSQLGLGGSIAELRLSNKARYAASFVPAKRFTPDADTILLAHFDEASGGAVHDASGHGNDGTIHGGSTWLVKASSSVALCTP